MADPRYEAAYAAYIESGNLAAASRDAGVNENSLRDFARRHGWRQDRERHVARAAELEIAADRGTVALVEKFYSAPSAKAHALARQGLDLRALVDSSAVEGGAVAYDGSKDSFRELTVAVMCDARRKGDMKTVRECLSLLADADGHTARPAAPKAGEAGQGAGPDWAAIKDLLDPQGQVFTGPGESVQTG